MLLLLLLLFLVLPLLFLLPLLLFSVSLLLLLSPCFSLPFSLRFSNTNHQNKWKSVPGGVPGCPGELPGEPGGSSASPGVSRDGPGEPFCTPQDLPWELSGLHFGCLFALFFPLYFEAPFLRILGGILASFWLLFGPLNQPRGALDAKRSILKNPCFT